MMFYSTAKACHAPRDFSNKPFIKINVSVPECHSEKEWHKVHSPTNDSKKQIYECISFISNSLTPFNLEASQ